MAEILLSLTIIGVVAAITLPSLTGNINERTWNTQRKALYARMTQAISLMPAINGYGTTNDTATETFLSDGLSKVLKINNICDNEHFQDCGMVATFNTLAGSKNSMPTTLYEFNSDFSRFGYYDIISSAMNTKAAAFETVNGESLIAFYNRSCRTVLLEQESQSTSQVYLSPQAIMCVNFVYDLNGTKGPNTVGRDIGFLTVFNATDYNIVAPMPSSTKYTLGSVSWSAAGNLCRKNDSQSRLPNIYELSSMSINRKFINFPAGNFYWSASSYSADKAWFIDAYANNGGFRIAEKSSWNNVRCIKR